jgi:hypothetical protein
VRAAHLDPGVELDDPWRPVGERAWEPALEHIRRLHDVVIDRDDRVPRLARLRIPEEVGGGVVGRRGHGRVLLCRRKRGRAFYVEVGIRDRAMMGTASATSGSPGEPRV